VFYGAKNTLFTALCFDLIAFYGLASTINLAGHAPTARRFILGYSAGVLGALTFKLVYDPNTQLDSPNILLPLVMALLLYILSVYGKELNKTHTHSLHLQFQNEQLIGSLTVEKQTALDAVAAKNRLIASAAHDMRQPVLALDLYSKWLTEDPGSTAELTPKIAVATQAVVALFDSMFDLAQLVEDKVKIQQEPVNIKLLLEDLSIQHRIVAQDKGLVLRTHMRDFEILTDPILLRRMVSNLISNAIKYTRQGGVLVACRPSSDGIRIEVWDTGTGISEEEQALVFREFYKGPLHNETNDGFGLGLSIVSQLAEKLNYRLEMKSRPRRGPMMAIHIPEISTP
jgi:signal transduction histidine kinase